MIELFSLDKEKISLWLCFTSEKEKGILLLQLDMSILPSPTQTADPRLYSHASTLLEPDYRQPRALRQTTLEQVKNSPPQLHHLALSPSIAETTELL